MLVRGHHGLLLGVGPGGSLPKGWSTTDKHSEIDITGTNNVIAGNTTGNWRAGRGETGLGAANIKGYFEIPWDNYVDNLACAGLGTAATDLSTIFGAGRAALNGWTGGTRLVGTGIAGTALPIWTSGKFLQVTYDSALGYIWLGIDDVYSNGALNANTGDPAAGTNPTVTVVANTVLYPLAIINGSSARIRYRGAASENVGTIPSGFGMWETLA